MPGSVPGESLTQSAFERLRREIVFGEIAPGERIRLKDVAARDGVSLSVVREAVTRLASEGLLESVPQQGFRVPSLSIDDLHDLTELRTHVEALAVEKSVGKGDLEWEASLVAAHHTLQSTPVGSEPGVFSREWMIAHDAFHRTLASACGSPRLVRLRQQLFFSSELFRYWANRVATVDDRMLDLEHQRILDAALGHEARRAAELVVEHIEKTAALIERGHEDGPDRSQD